MKRLPEVTWWKVSEQLQECRAGGREFKILGDVTEKLQAPNDVLVNGTVSRQYRPCITTSALCTVYFAAFAAMPCDYPQRDGQAELTWVACYACHVVSQNVLCTPNSECVV